MLLKPGKSRCLLKRHIQSGTICCANIHSTARVVLTEPWWSVDVQNLSQRQAALQLGTNESGLKIKAAKPRDQQQFNLLPCRRVAHRPPGTRRLGGEHLVAAIRAEAHRCQSAGIGKVAEAAHAQKRFRNAQPGTAAQCQSAAHGDSRRAQS